MSRLILGAAIQRIEGVAPVLPDAFLGEVSAASFITGPNLATAVGLTAGTAMNNSEPWLRFRSNGKLLWVAKRPLRYLPSWNQLNARGIVYGTRTVTIANKQYKVRLLTGSDSDPSDGADGGEWNRLIYPVCSSRPSGTPIWASYSIAQLGLSSGTNANQTICQNRPSADMTLCMLRGGAGSLSRVGYSAVTTVTNWQSGWRPVLELID